MKLSLGHTWDVVKAVIYKHYGENPGTMLVHTATLGWILSSAAQLSAVVFNEKISPEQKMFLIPQEIGDAAVNIFAFYTLTSGVKYIGKKLTQTAKLRTAELTKILKDRGYILEKGKARVEGKVYAGDWDFNVTKLPGYKEEISSAYKPFNNGAEVITGLVGSIISSNILTPIVRNVYAAKKQQDMIAHYNELKAKKEGVAELKDDNLQKSEPVNRVSFDKFRQAAYSHTFYPSGNLKI